MFSNSVPEKKKRKGFFSRRLGATATEAPTDPSIPAIDPVLDAGLTAPATDSRPVASPWSFRGDLPASAKSTLGIDFDQQSPQSPHLSQPGDSGLDGLPLAVYCETYQLTTAEVWQRLRSGELTGRTEKGHLLIYQQGTQANFGPLPIAENELPKSSAATLPPLPQAATNPAPTTNGYLALTGERSASPELAMLLDHLSLAKEENREILRMTQESIKKVTELTESLVDMKDSLLEAKEVQVRMLREQVEQQDRQLSKLKQQNEDLEMLARTLTRNN